jgi:hypothetical protein
MIPTLAGSLPGNNFMMVTAKPKTQVPTLVGFLLGNNVCQNVMMVGWYERMLQLPVDPARDPMAARMHEIVN